MAVTAPVSLSKIKTEFSGPNNLSAYTRGGTYVPNTAPNSAISTTVAGLAISQFLGAAAFTPFTDVYTSGSATITAPSGATSVTIRLWGGGGGGWTNYDAVFGGGAGAGFTLKTVSITGGSTQFSYSVAAGGTGGGAGGTSTVTSASPSISLTATGGGGYLTDPTAEGTGSGGDVNYSGFDAVGTDGGAAGGAGIGGQTDYGGAGYNGGAPGAGGFASDDTFEDGGRGEIWFEWS